MLRIYHFIACIWGVLTISCAAASSNFSAITPIPPSDEPNWLTILYPKPGRTTSLDIYNSAIRQTYSGLGAPEAPSSVCIQIWAGRLIEAGDYWEPRDVILRTTVFVDGVRQPIAPELVDGIVANTLRDMEDNVVASVGGPYAFCAIAAIDVGLHQVDVSFEKSSGELKQFSWTFSIVDGAIPTATPLPMPSIVDQNGDIPDFLRAVSPPSNELPDSVDSIFYSDMLDVWSNLQISEQDHICFALLPSELQALGSLPSNKRDWPDRIFITVDQQVLQNWLYHSVEFHEKGKEISAHCAVTNLEIGQHTATLYIDPFDEELIEYSWSFTKGK